jgi:hypothetical protein
MKLRLQNLALCEGCHLALQTDPNTPPLLAQFQRWAGNLHYTNNHDEFSRRVCDVCGTHLHGARYIYNTYI